MTPCPMCSRKSPGTPAETAEGPVFNEPWEARPSPWRCSLSESGYFAWAEWADVS